MSLAGCEDGSDGTGGGGTGGDTGGGGTGGMATGGGGMATGGGGTGGTGSALSCEAYCDAVAANCTGNNSQYGDEPACLAICAAFPVGMESDTSGNSLGCRTYHGGAPATGDPGTHCPHAGPLGGGGCGEDCKNFCALAVALCGEQATPPYANTDECETACMAFPDTMTVPYNATVTSGNSLACRMYHLTVGSTSAENLMIHCPHVAAESEPCK